MNRCSLRWVSMGRGHSRCGLLLPLLLSIACAKSSGSADAGSDAGVDAGPPGLTCAQLLNCDAPCSSDACTDGCYAGSTAVAQGLFDALDDCIDVQCPSTPGGPCASSSSMACSSCNQNAALGACVTNLVGCEMDTAIAPANPDGGTTAPDAGTPMATLNCGGLIACVAACPLDGGSCQSACDDDATPEARALDGVLASCLAMACPSTDGGPCADPGSAACNGCQEQVEFAEPDTCAPPFVACNSDTSNAPDGGASPRSLVDGGVLSTTLGGIMQAASTLAVSGGYLYFTQVVSDSPVRRLWLGDGGTVSTIGPLLPTPVSLAVDSNNVYAWSTGTFPLSGSTNNSDGTVVQIPLDGGAAITLGQGQEVEYDAPYLNAIAVDARNVYWVKGATGADGVIMRAAIGDASAVPLFTNQVFPEAIATDGTNVYWTNWGTFDAQGHTNNDGTLMQGPVDGGAPIVLATNLAAPASIAVDAHNVYWTNLGPLGGGLLPAAHSGSVMQVAIGGGSAITLASEQAIPIGLAVANGVVYWTAYGLSEPGLIMSAPVGGGAVVPLAAGLPDPTALTIGGDALYWSNTPSSDNGGAIFSLSPF